ncbi:MAG: DUF4340 domain-containing protein [Gemmatimonadales bacterium]
MSNEQLRRIAIALAALLVLWLLLLGVRRVARQEGPTLPRPSVDAGAVDRITIERPTDTIRLAKGATGWTVNGYGASGERVGEFFAAVNDSAATSELVAESASTHQQLGVDSANARRLEIATGDREVLTYLVGKRGASFESAYIRRPDRNNVYQVRGRLVEMIERSVADWRDKAILHLEPDSLGRIEIERGPRRYALARSDSGWRFVDGSPTDSTRIATLLDQFRRFEASSFPSDADAAAASFDPADRVVRLFGRGDILLASLRLDSTAAGFLVRRDTMATIYQVPAWVADQLSPADSTLRAAGPPASAR